MAVYKQKYTQYIITSSKQPAFTLRNDMIILNLNACFARENNFTKFMSILSEAIEFGNKVNLCNLASLCFKFGYNYGSEQTLNFVKSMIEVIKTEFPDLTLMQQNIYNYGEIDTRPIEHPIRFDIENDIIYVNSIITDSLKKLGFVDTQFFETLQYAHDLREVIPPDIMKLLPIATPKNLQYSEKIRNIILG